MAQDRNQQRRFASMTTRQKATIGALVVVVLIVVWQVMGLFGSDSPVTPIAPTETKTATMSATSPPAPGPMSPNAPPNPTASPSMVSPPSVSPPVNPTDMQASPPIPETQVKQTPVTLENKMLEAQKNAEEKYIDQLNRLQLLKVQREIEEMNQAIAAARLATVTAEKNVSDLLTKPTKPPVIEAPAAPPPGPLTAPVALQGLEAGTQPPPVPQQEPPPPPKPIEIPYVVISVSMQLGKWNAVVSYQGKLYNVVVGDVLPEDNSIVTAINKNGVTLMSKEGKRRKVSILTAI